MTSLHARLRRPPVRWGLLAWGLGLPICLVLGHLAAQHGVQPGPPGIAESRTSSIGASIWPTLAFAASWGVVVALVAAIASRASALAVVAFSWVGVLVLGVSGCTLWYASAPGCGEPRSSLLLPLPDGVEVTDVGVGEPISGPQQWRILVTSREGRTDDELWAELLDHYGGQRWAFTTNEATTELDDGRRSAVAETGDGWYLGLTTDAYSELDEQISPDEVRVELRHTPSDDRGCINW